MSSSRRPDDGYTGDTIPMNIPPNTRPPGGREPQGGQPRSPHYAPQQPVPQRRARRNVAPPGAQPPIRRSKKRAGFGTWLRRAALALIIGIVLLVAGTIVFQQRVAAKVRMADVRDNRPPGSLLVTPMNILLLGVDLRPDYPEEGVRSDTLMLLHLDPAGGWASLLSIPRDTFTEIPGYGEGKINAGFGNGYRDAGENVDPTAAGAALAADTVEQFLGLRERGERIDYVATINFNGFAKMIDAIGGIEVDVPNEIVDTAYPTEDFGTTTITIPAGKQQMDGETALQYVRTRHADSDFGRAQRQQQVIQAIVQKLRSQPLVLRPYSVLRLIDAAGDAIRTTLPVGRLDALLMVGMAARIDPAKIVQYRITPEQVGLQEFGSDLVWNQADVQNLVGEALTPPGEAQEQATVQVQNGAGTGGLAGRLTQALAAQQFTLTTADNAEVAPASKIIDYGAHPITSARLSKVLGNMPVEQRPAAENPGGANIIVVLGEDYQQYWRDQ